MKKLAALIIGIVMMSTLLLMTACGVEPLTNEEIGFLTDSDFMEVYIETEYGSEYNGELCDELCDDEYIVFYVYNGDGFIEAMCSVDRDYFVHNI
jgi:hypothetical protein